MLFLPHRACLSGSRCLGHRLLCPISDPPLFLPKIIVSPYHHEVMTHLTPNIILVMLENLSHFRTSPNHRLSGAWFELFIPTTCRDVLPKKRYTLLVLPT